jgi:DNA-binding NarL/FixJ family response regulator
MFRHDERPIHYAMASLPRVITVDPTFTLARIMRGAMDLINRPIIQVDVPSGGEALEEAKRGGATLVVTAWELYDDIQGLELALRIKQVSPETSVVILAEEDDPHELDAETLADSPFVYMHRPVDIHQFMRVLVAGVNGDSIFDARSIVSSGSGTMVDHGPLPGIDAENARKIIKRLLVDIGAMAIILATRTGDVLLEDGAPGYLDREQLTNALMPMVTTTLEMSVLVGGQAQSIQFYDGDDKDVFVFSVGLHHYLCAVFDGQAGSRQFGVVNSYGRRAVQDLIALLGASAFVIQRQEVAAAPVEEASRPKKGKKATEEVEKLEPMLVRPEVKTTEPEPLRLEPIQNLDFSIFDQLDTMESGSGDDMFDLDKLAEMVNKGSGRKEVSFEEAMELGVLPDIESDAKAKKP